MKITLISLDQMIISYGLRLISSCLKKDGHEVEMIFARAVIGRPLPADVENQVVRLCQSSDLIGISLMSNHFPQAISLTQKIKKKLNVPIIWGGVHPTFCPEESLKYADMVCLGEGEESMLRLVKRMKAGQEITKTPGIWFKKNGEIIKNETESLVGDLDSLPFPDFGPEGHFIRDGRKVKKMTKDLFEKFLTKRETPNGEFVAEYYISTSRGCPFRCAYCASNTIKNLYHGQRFFRLRRPEKVIEEVKTLVDKFNFIKWIYFADDDLLASPIERIKIFCYFWKKEIDLPFYATVAPWSYSEEKLRLFLDAGLGIINMGIQTVSKRGVRVYHRLAPKKKLREITSSIHKLKLPMPPLYDFILDNPYESDKDRLENLDFILKIPKPRKFQLFSLVPFPGTEIYTRMKNDGLLTDEEKMIYQKSYSYPEANYINMLTYLANTDFPTSVVKLLRGRIFLFLFNNKVSKWLFKKIPYSAFLILARNLFNLRFWRFNIKPKGEF
ncbi:MAG: B12-binding domain-containing radical SAM protein [Patescibacteria group bacterium]